MKKIMFMVLILILLMTGCTDKKKAQEDLNLVIGFIPHIQFTPLYVGIEKGIFAKHGINLNINYGFGLDTFGLLTSSKADIALSDADQLIISHNKGYSLQSIFQYYKKYPTSIVSLNNINTPEGLIGKKIGVPELYGTSYIGTKKFLSHYNLDDRVELVRIGYTQIPSLLSNQVDAVVCFYNNEPIQLRMKNYEITEWKIADISELVGASFITGETQLKNKRKLLKQFNEALSESIIFTTNNIPESIDIAYKTIGSLNEDDKMYWNEVLQKTLEIINGENTDAGILDTKLYQETIEELYKLKLISVVFDAKEIITQL
ncbi:MAG: hypothetical protein A2015_12370 [Spirochaetes bacterium GWF1_31_7]|nr:MAG: hypothetical protein A2Y30_09315 [Spirochaetes bacterium GWE1_32_154]OHD49004.1 MAG: hypothetical protein A2Y29_17175 [Spirochaetes bacterium GWE2_31_10]OHD49556.1 MAG: hypothetical protein A2015_12370 [Spirochaetes bacterium GWF1_31_7]OHD76951.1 MAG: hypothetical protein A2355_03015 [Spirochaetes bacterium RIFOXYB1_FULL_32_8]